MGSIQGGHPRAVHPRGPFKWVHPRRHQGPQAWLSGVQAPPLHSPFPADLLPAGRREVTLQDLLAMRLQLDNGTALPTTAAAWLRWRVRVLPGHPKRPGWEGALFPYPGCVPTAFFIPSRW